MCSRSPLWPTCCRRCSSATGRHRADSQPQRGARRHHLLRHHGSPQLEGFNKFIPYYLHPKATYSIGLSKSSFRTKVSVGSNPWTKADPAKMVNLAQVCERYGGGGHARVGAISFPPDQADKARAAAAEIVAELGKESSAVNL